MGWDRKDIGKVKTKSAVWFLRREGERIRVPGLIKSPRSCSLSELTLPITAGGRKGRGTLCTLNLACVLEPPL